MNRNGSACCWGQKEAAGWNPAQERLLMQSVAGVPRGDGDDGISWWRYWPHPDGDADGGDNAAERGGGRAGGEKHQA